jgi:small-conductance mechanosensitive channel
MVRDTTLSAPWLADMWEKLDSLALVIGQQRYSLAGVLVFVIAAVAIYVAARLTFWLIRRGIRRTRRLGVGQQLLAEKIAGIVIIVVAVMIGIDLIGFDLSALTVFSGAAGLAIGFGLQKTFGNLIAGLILLMDRSVKPGDVIVVGEHFGAINKIGVRAVSVITRDGKEHLIPNELLMTEPVENWSYSSRNVRVQIPVGVSYGSDLGQVEQILLECAKTSGRVLQQPQPTVWLKEFGDSSVNFEIQVWIADPEEGVGNVRSDVLKAVWRAFKENKVEIPFPQRDLHVRSMPAFEAKG